MAAVPRITPQELKREMEAGEVTVVDVRRGSWNEGGAKIAGAIRIDPERYQVEAERVPRNGMAVTYCT